MNGKKNKASCACGGGEGKEEKKGKEGKDNCGFRPDSVLVFYEDESFKTAMFHQNGAHQSAEVQRVSDGGAQISIISFWHTTKKVAKIFHRGPLKCQKQCSHGINQAVDCNATTLQLSIPRGLRV